jgi:hypothetical protein
MTGCRGAMRTHAVLAMLLTASCGGGGDAGDIDPNAALTSEVAADEPNDFLLMPNPVVQPDGSHQTNTAAYAQAYYAAIDPANGKDTLAKWKAANGFDSGTGTQVSVVFGDTRDLGYGRRMTVRQNPDGTVAAFVENFLVDAVVDYAYAKVNLDAAAFNDRRWHDGTNAIEFSPGPGGGLAFAKFFAFDSATGDRELAVQLDGRGQKAMPGPCISCHGGRADALTPSGQFAILANSASAARGDLQGKMLPLEVDHLDFLAMAPYRRVDQEGALKAINSMILCTYPRPASEPAGAADGCRRAATANEWQGTAAALIKGAYGGNDLPNPTYADEFVPAGWVGQEALYAGVVVPSCRACHIARGYGRQSDVDLGSYAKLQGFAGRTRAHVLDRGNMPLAKIVYQDFWASPARVQQLAAFLEGEGFTVRDPGGAVLRPGRPIAIPGPDRVVLPGATALSAAGSLYATAYRWSIVSGPAGATLSSPNAAQTLFNAAANGTYVLQLIASAGGVDSAPATLMIVVDSTLSPAPAAIAFADIKAVLQSPGCAGCHGGNPTMAPILFTNIDRDGSGAYDATDDLWLLAEVRGRINFRDLESSPLLRKPAGDHHFGLMGTNFDASLSPGDALRRNYDLFLNWALNGAPQ